MRATPTNLTAAQLAHVERRLGGRATIRGTELHQELVEHYGYVAPPAEESMGPGADSSTPC